MSRQARDPVSGSWMPIAGYPEIDAALDIESTNPIQNQAVANPIEAMVNVYGSKNLLPNNATTQVVNGVTFTVNSDGSITVNGTATSGDAQLNINTAVNLPEGHYIVTGRPQNAAGSYIAIKSGNNWFADTGEGVIVDGAISQITIVVQNTYNINSLTFRPMIRDARITDPTYVPYAMTNRDLTNIIAPALTKAGWISHAGNITVARLTMGCFIYLYAAGSNGGVSVYTIDGAGKLFLLYASNNNLTCTITQNANNTTTITCSGSSCYYSVVYSLRHQDF